MILRTSDECGDEFNYPLNTPEDFNFEFKISDSDKEYLYNSINQKLYKTIYFDKIDTLEIILKERDKEKIWNKLISINSLYYPETYEVDDFIEVSDSDSFSFFFKFNGITKRINFKNHRVISSNKKIDDLVSLFRTIDSIIINKQEFMNSREAEYLIE
ncbi:hypothetical protein ULMS_08900 [Patiriisocius marinistellae]|uniref:Uncharacterized protein n=1 Tax=Patiriisocius marinistellae TaxID=2494560 RepID=A0A5J4FW32_9FLAO|nr:hypothetical protein ULMS_08900 [Patiriisocius marinistellae]